LYRQIFIYLVNSFSSSNLITFITSQFIYSLNIFLNLDKFKAEKIADKARNSIGKICMEDCHAFCCRKGYLVLEEKEVDKVTHNQRDKLIETHVLKKLEDGKYSLNLASKEGSCPSLKDNKCAIYTETERPKACHRFPVFIHEKTVRLSPRCLAVKMGVFYPFEKEWIKLGYKIDKGSPLTDSDFYIVHKYP
jgi:Fe-S-cluster containining protein